jgi:SAM-dependent methyltransferase
MGLLRISDPALSAYEAMAPWYDGFTASYDHERWLKNLEQVAIGHGLCGHSALDIGCGTGKSFEPLLDRGYRVTACDLSPEMVVRARRRARGRAVVEVADMRRLPVYGQFELVVCLDDALNYLLSEEELAAAFTGAAANLAPAGVFVFDLNTLATYRGAFASVEEVREGSARYVWRGEGDGRAAPGAIASAVIEVLSREGVPAASSRHVQRHHPPAVVRSALTVAGLEIVDLRGQLSGAAFERPPDEAEHAKLVYFARHGSAEGAGRQAKGVRAA